LRLEHHQETPETPDEISHPCQKQWDQNPDEELLHNENTVGKTRERTASVILPFRETDAVLMYTVGQGY
jgi:hypothetical protein